MNMYNLMVTFIVFIFRLDFWVNLVEKFKIVSLS